MRKAAADRRVKEQEPVSIYDIVSSGQMRGPEWLEKLQTLSSRSASRQAAYEVAEYLRNSARQRLNPVIHSYRKMTAKPALRAGGPAPPPQERNNRSRAYPVIPP